jgi:hypothetical protein
MYLCPLVQKNSLLLGIYSICRRNDSGWPISVGERNMVRAEWHHSCIISVILSLIFLLKCHSHAVDTDILHVEILGASIITLNTQEAAIELFDRRSKFYSSRWVSFISPVDMHRLHLVMSLRPNLPMLELTKLDYNFGFLPYGKDILPQSFMVRSLMALCYDKAPNGEHAAEPFISIFEWARRKSTMAICSMERINFFKIY